MAKTPAPEKNTKNELAELRATNEELRDKVRELEETLEAIQSGEVDAIVVSNGEGRKVFTLEGADHPYRALVENIREGALTLSRTGMILYTNTRFAEMVKLPAEKVIGVSILNFVCPEHRSQMELALADILERPCRSRVRIHQDKGSLPVYLSMNPLTGDENTKISVVVTDRRKDEERLRMQARMLDAVGDAVIAADMHNKIIYWNDAATKIYGWEPEEALGRDLIDVATPEISKKEAREIADRLKKGETWTGEYFVKHRDGHEFPIYASDAPVFDDDGKLIAIIGASHDITEQKQAQINLASRNQELNAVNEELRAIHEELRQTNDELVNSNESLRATEEELRNTNDELVSQQQIVTIERDRVKNLLDIAGVMILGLDRNGKVTMINRRGCEILGRPEEGIVGNDWVSTFLPMEIRADMRKTFRDVIANGIRDFRSHENAVITRDGSQRDILWSNALIRDGQGRVTGILSSGEDITERKKAEELLRSQRDNLNALNEEITATQEELKQNVEELTSSEKELRDTLAEKEVLLSEIHHRVKNNLTAFISLLSLEGSYEETPAGKALKLDLQNRARTMALIHETLYKTRQYSDVDMQVYLSTLVEQVVSSHSIPRSVKTIINANGITLDLARATPIGLIVNELVTNSLKYAFPGGVQSCQPGTGDACQITIRITKEDGKFAMSVADNGVRLPGEFDPAKTKTLGLKLVNFLSRHQLRAEPEVHRERGTEFVFRFKT